MAPVGYTFNANKPKYRSKDRNGSKRRIILFLFLTGVMALLLYLFVFNTEEKNNKVYVGSQQQPEIQEKAVEKTEKTAVPELKPVIDNKTEAKTEVKTQVSSTIQSFPEMESMLEKAQLAFDQQKYPETRELCYKILDSRKVPDENLLWLKTADLLGKANVKIFFSDLPFTEKKVNYHVKPNDGLRKIAMDHNTSIEAVQRSNNMKLDDLNVQLGQTFNIYVGDWKIVISKSRRKLYLFDGKKLFKFYNVGIGKQDRTPTGEFKTGGKRKNPDWYSPQGRIPFGEKGNVLGTRWIRLNSAGKTSRPVSGLGIHGTWEPDSIGKAKSNGCLRMLNQEVEELFAILPNELKPVSVTIID
jgi:lipoprotein-anchoring transpeptidase ErfK/SrfK